MRFWSRTSPASGPDWHAQEIDWPATAAAVTAAKSGDKPTSGSLLQTPELVDAKVRLHRKLVDELNLSHIEKIPRAQLRHQVHGMISDYVTSERLPLNSRELSEFVDEVMDELIGLGPIEPILRDPIGHGHFDQHSRACLCRTWGAAGACSDPFQGRGTRPAHRQQDRRCSRSSRRRVLANGRCQVARRLAHQRGREADCCRRPVGLHPQVCEAGSGHGDFGRKTARSAQRWRSVLAQAVRARLSILISGGTGSGKTTFLNALSSYISHKGAFDHDRGCSRAPIAATARGAPGDASAEYRGAW